jgi:hypothetical protein
MNPLHDPVALRAKYRCEYCRAPEENFNFAFEVEHILPKARGGSDALDNLALGCSACNVYKGVFETGYDMETETETPLFHPRRDNWDEHFAFQRETGEIVGLTPTGRATVKRLQLNHPRQIRARLLWMQAGNYP